MKGGFDDEDLVFEELVSKAKSHMSSNQISWEYSGQTTEELIALQDSVRHEQLVMAIAHVLWRKDTKSKSEAELVITAVETLINEVLNGGFSLFFTNSSVEHAPQAVERLRAIGCPKTAEIVENALAALHLQEVTAEAITQAMEVDDIERDRALDECDREFYKFEENVPEMEFQFILANRASIRIA